MSYGSVSQGDEVKNSKVFGSAPKLLSSLLASPASSCSQMRPSFMEPKFCFFFFFQSVQVFVDKDYVETASLLEAGGEKKPSFS